MAIDTPLETCSPGGAPGLTSGCRTSLNVPSSPAIVTSWCRLCAWLETAVASSLKLSNFTLMGPMCCTALAPDRGVRASGTAINSTEYFLRVFGFGNVLRHVPSCSLVPHLENFVSGRDVSWSGELFWYDVHCHSTVGMEPYGALIDFSVDFFPLSDTSALLIVPGFTVTNVIGLARRVFYLPCGSVRLDFRLILSAFRREIVLCMLVPTLDGDLVRGCSSGISCDSCMWSFDGLVPFPHAERREFPSLLVLAGPSIASAYRLSRAIALNSVFVTLLILMW